MLVPSTSGSAVPHSWVKTSQRTSAVPPSCSARISRVFVVFEDRVGERDRVPKWSRRLVVPHQVSRRRVEDGDRRRAIPLRVGRDGPDIHAVRCEALDRVVAGAPELGAGGQLRHRTARAEVVDLRDAGDDVAVRRDRGRVEISRRGLRCRIASSPRLQRHRAAGSAVAGGEVDRAVGDRMDRHLVGVHGVRQCDGRLLPGVVVHQDECRRTFLIEVLVGLPGEVCDPAAVGRGDRPVQDRSEVLGVAIGGVAGHRPGGAAVAGRDVDTVVDRRDPRDRRLAGNLDLESVADYRPAVEVRDRRTVAGRQRLQVELDLCRPTRRRWLDRVLAPRHRVTDLEADR